MGRQDSGFTLLELLITLAISAILLGVAVPATQTLLANNRVVAATNSVLGVLHNARSEAIRHNREVQISPGAINNGETPEYRWQQGVVMSVYQEDDILRRTGPVSSQLLLTVSNVSEEQNAFGFSPNGFLNGDGQTLEFVFCNKVRPGNSRSIAINAGGQISMSNLDLTGCDS